MEKEMFDLTGKVALVTGGNSGIGLGFATGFAKAGADIVLWGRRRDKNDEAAMSLRAHGVAVTCQTIDVTSEEQVATGMAEAVATMGRVDCVFANAGISTKRPTFLDVSSETYHELIAVNQHGAFYTLREGFRHMKDRADRGDPGGSLIANGSLTIHAGAWGLPHYAMSKGAMAALTKSLALEGGPYGVRANMVCPGYIATDIIPEGSGHLTDMLREGCPIPRWGRPADLEGIAVYLMSDASRYHTGDVVVIDGGWSAALGGPSPNSPVPQ